MPIFSDSITPRHERISKEIEIITILGVQSVELPDKKNVNN